jgi:chromosomal replication initiation ATPase DnaA
LRAKDDWEKGDERILGGGDFVETVLRSQPPLHSSSRGSATKILEEVCKKCEVQPKQILSRLRGRRISQARRVFFLRAQEEAGESLTSLARLCGVAHTSVLEAIEKAKIERQNG